MGTFSEEIEAEVEAAKQASSDSDGVSNLDTTGDEQASSTGEYEGVPPDTGSDNQSRKTIPLRAYEDEREKRQYERKLREGLERRVAELEGVLTKTRQQASQEPEIDYERIWEDPKAVLEEHTQKIAKQFSASSLEVSREMARAQLPDWDETIAKLQTIEVPGINEAIARSKAPAFTAYRMVKEAERKQKENAGAGSRVKELEAKLAEATAQLESIASGSGRPSVRSLSQSRGSSSGIQQPVKTQEQVLNEVWGKKLRARR